jgi:peptidoglycan/LPS O-acetylase OafA/YrhL
VSLPLSLVPLSQVEPLKNARILELDGLRALAVMLVVFYHMVNFSGAIPMNNLKVMSLIEFLGSGGVHIFFVISGMIITSLLIRENATKGRVSLRSFYQRRFLRIIPPFAVYLFVLILLCQIGYLTIQPINFLLSGLFLGNLGLFEGTINSGTYFVGHTWSLAVEEQYYLILPPIMVIILRFRLRPINILLVILFGISLIANKLAKEASLHINPALITLATFFHFRYILVGVLMAIHRHTVHKLLKETSGLLALAMVGLIIGISYIHVSATISVLLTGLESILYGLLVAWFIENPEKCAFLRWGWIQWIGTCSYSIYMWQQLFTGKPTCYNGWTIAQSPFAIVAIVGCAALSYYLVELPSIRFSRLHFSK